MTTPTRTEFEADAYQYIRTMAGEKLMCRLITSQERPCFDTAIAAAMGWPTVPQQEKPCSD